MKGGKFTYLGYCTTHFDYCGCATWKWVCPKCGEIKGALSKGEIREIADDHKCRKRCKACGQVIP